MDWKNLLEDPSLLNRAVTIGWSQAVPVGGHRRGGFICVMDEAHSQEVILALSADPEGFPNPRYIPGDHPEVADNVRWGEEELPCPAIEAEDLLWVIDDILNGLFYGYKAEAIVEYVVRQWGLDPEVVGRIVEVEVKIRDRSA